LRRSAGFILTLFLKKSRPLSLTKPCEIDGLAAKTEAAGEKKEAGA
jgi:hypothetical protein